VIQLLPGEGQIVICDGAGVELAAEDQLSALSALDEIGFS
jgi:hypothetical protein